EAALQRFAALGIPTLEDEDWRFTPLSALTKGAFELGTRAKVDLALVRRIAFAPDDCHRIVFVNGQFAPALSSVANLPNGAIVASLAEMLQSQRDRVEPSLAQYADYEDHAFTALNTAFIQDGAFVFLPKNAVVEKPIYLLFVSSAGGSRTVSH